MPIPPIRRQIVVPIGPHEAFEVFTRDIGAWWPLEKQSVTGSGGSVAFHDAELIETSSTGTTVSWAQVLEWAPGERLRLSWFPGGTPDRATEVRLHFEGVETAGDGRSTLVTLEHVGWERLADPEDARREYENGWPGVVRQFADATLGWQTPDGRTWLVLRHSAGATAPEHGPIFADPNFSEHAAFLERLADAGVLLAAGPLVVGDQPGAHGLTVIRVPDDEVPDYIRLAATDDQSVVRGLLDVEVTTWNVLMSSR